MLGNAGIAYKDITEYALAESNLVDAIAIAGEGDSRDKALYLGMLSRLYIKLDRLEEAANVAGRILASRVISSRAKKQLTLFLAKTNRLNSTIIREIRPQIRAAVAEG